MEPGDKCICQYDEWYPAFEGGKAMPLSKGQRLTVRDSIYIGGARFYLFEGIEKASYLSTGFKPLRSLN